MTGQVVHKYRTSTGQVTESVERILLVIDREKKNKESIYYVLSDKSTGNKIID